MQVKGNILLILLIMLLFASAVVLQLSEDAYVTHLIATHVDKLSASRRALNAAFKQVSASLNNNQACYTDANLKSEFEDFWSRYPGCYVTSAGLTVDYALYDYQQKNQTMKYVQYTLRVENNVTSIWLQVIMSEKSNAVVSQVYY